MIKRVRPSTNKLEVIDPMASRASLLRSGEESWQGALDNLVQRFSQLDPATVVEQLRQNGGHAGRTASALRKLPADVESAPRDPLSSNGVAEFESAQAERLEAPKAVASKISTEVLPRKQAQEPQVQKTLSRSSTASTDSKLLFVAALQGDVQQLIHLISEGADLNDRYTGRPQREQADKIIDATPLHLVVTMGLTNVAEVLLRHGAAIEAKMQRALGHGKPPAEQYSEMTALHLAAMEGHTNIVEMLLEHGADQHAQMVLCERQGDRVKERAITPVEIAREMASKGHTRASVIALLGAPI
jgi:hypothetical protein